MLRYAARLIPAGSAPVGALVEPLVANPPPSPLGEHTQIPQVAWMVERDGAFVHLEESERDQLDLARGAAELTKLDATLSSETLEHIPGIHIATNGEYAAELLLDHDHLAAVHQILGHKVYLAAAPRHGRFLVGGVGAGIEGMRAFVHHVRHEHDAAPASTRISPIALLVRDASPTAVVGELQIAALAHAAQQR